MTSKKCVVCEGKLRVEDGIFESIKEDEYFCRRCLSSWESSGGVVNGFRVDVAIDQVTWASKRARAVERRRAKAKPG